MAVPEIGYGPEAKGLTWQADFPETTPCCKCGKEARLAIGIQEGADAPRAEGETPIQEPYVTNEHPNDPEGEGFWLHDAGAFATYLCTDINCASATTLYNQA
ncbi:MAG: hypothetical protein ACRD6W_03830 [Nitrososphaerales archaeon]